MRCESKRETRKSKRDDTIHLGIDAFFIGRRDAVVGSFAVCTARTDLPSPLGTNLASFSRVIYVVIHVILNLASAYVERNK